MKSAYTQNFTRNRPPGISSEVESRTSANGVVWPFAFVFALVLLLLSGIASASTGLSDVQGGQLLFKIEEDFVRSPTLESHAKMVVNGPIARVTLSQTFQNTTDRWQEALYAFPLVEDAAVDGLTIRVGTRVIQGEVQEKQQAKKTYQQAKKAGKVAGLLEQNRPNLFTTSVANIPPHEKIEIEIQYQQTIGFRDGVFSLRFPMTLTPRYVPSDASLKGITSPTFQVSEAKSEIAPPMMGDDALRLNLISMEIDLDAGMSLSDITSHHHPIVSNDMGTSYQIRLQDGMVPMDQDFELSWRPHIGVTPEATVITEEVNGATYAMMMVYPPNTNTSKTFQNREMILVIDSSGSMGGVSIVQAKAALGVALEKLKPGDFFNIVDFDSDARRLFDHSKPVTQNTLEDARGFIARLTADGGTEMHRALALALAQPSQLGLLRQVIFVTDGSVGNEEALFHYIQKHLDQTRLFTVGIGSAPNMYFMRSAARFGRGTYTYINAQDQVTEKMTQLFEKIESPALTDLKLDFGTNGIAEVWPSRIPDVYKGEPLFFTAKLPSSNSLNAEITGAISQSPWKRRLNHGQPKVQSGIAKYWARQKIAALMDQKIMGKDPEVIRNEVIPVALEHELVTRYTSLVAVEQTPSNPNPADLESKKVPNHLPVGMQYPSTATFWPLKLMFGLILMLWATTLMIIYRRRVIA